MIGRLMSKLQAISYLDVKDSECDLAPAKETPEERELIQKFRDQVSLINKGFVVYVSGVEKAIDKGDLLLVKVTLSSNVNGMQMFGENVQLKFTKQTLDRLKTEITRAM